MARIAIVKSKGDPWKAASLFFGADEKRKEAAKKRAFAEKCREMAFKALADAKALDKEAAADSEELLERTVLGENPGKAGAL